MVVLDGGWDRVDDGEGVDAPRQLGYVAMPRARRTLALTRFDSAGCAGGTRCQPAAGRPRGASRHRLPHARRRAHRGGDG